MKFNCIIVVYNVRCENSKALSSLQKVNYNELGLIVCDNSVISTVKNNNKLYCKLHKMEYFDMGGSLGLSKAYNKAINNVSSDDWVVIFDQDTEIVMEYFYKLSKSIERYPDIYLHVPIVNSKNNQMSPSIARKYSVKIVNGITSGSYENLTAINSGMAIKKTVYETVGVYNEDIFLDYLDHYFVREYKKVYKKIALFDCVLSQDFSNDDHSDFGRDIKRFKIFVKDFYVYCKDTFNGRVFFLIKTLYRSVKLAIMHKNVNFLKIFFEGRKL